MYKNVQWVAATQTQFHILSMLSIFQNKLLALLPAEDRLALAPLLKRRKLARHDLLLRAQDHVDNVIFIEDGVVSILAQDRPGLDVEVAMIGREGMIGAQLLHGVFTTYMPVKVRIEGSGYEIAAPDFIAFSRKSARFRDRICRYLEWRHVQMGMIAMSGRQGDIPQNIARVLLMLHDRLDGDSIPITHEELARQVAAHRPGVTIALHLLEGERLVRANRGNIFINDRPGLETLAGDFYGMPENAWFEILCGPSTGPVLAD